MNQSNFLPLRVFQFFTFQVKLAKEPDYHFSSNTISKIICVCVWFDVINLQFIKTAQCPFKLYNMIVLFIAYLFRANLIYW